MGQACVEAGVDLVCLEPWREAVRGAADAVALIELPSTRFIELSRYARHLVGPDSDFGLQVLAPDERPEAAAIIHAANAGVIDGTEVRRRRWQRADSSTLEVAVRARVIRLGAATFGVWVARELSPPEDSPWRSSSDALEWPVGDRSQAPSVVATLDERWRVSRLTGDADHLRDVLREGVAVTAVTHSDDMARLLFAFAGATTHIADVAASVRLLSGDEPVAVDITVGRDEGGLWRLAFAPVREREATDPPTGQRVKELEESLRRIATELQGSGLVTRSAATVDILLIQRVSELPERQREIVVRLARGERVGTIAAKMYLSANTVRNHLSLVFRKFGVHSQGELLLLLLGDEGDESPSAT